MRWFVMSIPLLVFLIGCYDAPPQPNQEAVERAEKHADKAIERAEVAEQEIKHSLLLVPGLYRWTPTGVFIRIHGLYPHA